MNTSQWVSIAFGLIGGVGMFLYGMSLMSGGLQKVAGDKLKKILEKLTSNRFFGMIVGAVVTVLVQSSTATTVMIVGFVNAGLMNLMQALSVILGANIGTTITAQILAFKVTVIALPAVGIGAIIVVFLSSERLKFIGEIILGFGLLFFGMKLMTDSTVPLQASPAIREIFVNLSSYPFLAMLVGAIATIVLQSSAATIGITIALATNGLVDYQGAIAILLGDNLGTTITANIAAIGGSRAAKQAAFGHFLFNLIGVAYMLILLKPFMGLVDYLTPGDPSFVSEAGTFPYMARHIANAHTFFNLINAFLFLPLLPVLAFLCEKIIKSDPKQNYKYTHLSDMLANTPETAVAQVRQEVNRMASMTMAMLKTIENAAQKQDVEDFKKVKKYEKRLDGFKGELIPFIELVQSKDLSSKASHTLDCLANIVNNLEITGDHSRNIMKKLRKMSEKEQILSDEAKKELNEILDAVIYFATKTFTALALGKKQDEKDFLVEDEIDGMYKRFRKNHLKRLNDNECTIDTGVNYMDILAELEAIADQVYNVAQLNLSMNENINLRRRSRAKSKKEKSAQEDSMNVKPRMSALQTLGSVFKSKKNNLRKDESNDAGENKPENKE